MKGSFFCLAFALAFALFGVPVLAQTCDITWRKADNPRVISGTVAIPAGQTVCTEPGLVARSDSNAQLQLYGNLLLQGTAAEPVVFSSVPNPKAMGAPIHVVGKLNHVVGKLNMKLPMSKVNSAVFF